MVFTVQNPPRRSQRYHRNAEVNITNLMDVMMVLLVVFMVCLLYTSPSPRDS